MTECVPVTVASDRLQREEPTTVGVPFPTTRLSGDRRRARLPQPRPDARLLRRPRRSPRGADIRTGDLGRIDERGRVFLTGRLKDLIISGGLNIAPAEIEAVACEHPGVVSAVVVGIPDDRWGETPVVVAVPARGNGVAARDVLQHCRRELTSLQAALRRRAGRRAAARPASASPRRP